MSHPHRFCRLVNRTHPLAPDAPPPPLVYAREAVDGLCHLKRRDIRMHLVAAAALRRWFLRAHEQGVRDLLLVSGYRSYDEQSALFAAKRAIDPTYGDAIDLPVAVAHPCASEHRTGLAIDVSSLEHPELEESFAATPQGAWLRASCVSHGFVLRYPPEKQARTGVVFEPWHFRYVGKAAAREMEARGFCLEEYVARCAGGSVSVVDSGNSV